MIVHDFEYLKENKLICLLCLPQESLVEANELLYFADVCAGPGGFSEYILWRKKGESKGFGMTLKGSNDFKLEDFYAGPPEMFEPHYGKFCFTFRKCTLLSNVFT